MSAERDLHALACGVHGALVALHLLGVGYGVKRDNRLDAVIHALCVIFSGRAMRHHLRKCR